MPKGASDLARHNLSFNHPCLYAASVYRETDPEDVFSARSSLKQGGEVGVSRRSVQIISRGRHVSRTLHQRTSEPKLMRRKMRVWCLGKGASGACGHRPLSVHDGCERSARGGALPCHFFPFLYKLGNPHLSLFPLDAFAENVAWTPFPAQTRPGKRPFRAKARPRLQSERRERPFFRKCVQAGGREVDRHWHSKRKGNTIRLATAGEKM